MPVRGDGVCRYCGNTFNFRKQPLGRSLCPLCIRVLEGMSIRRPLGDVAKQFNVGVEAVISWSRWRQRRAARQAQQDEQTSPAVIRESVQVQDGVERLERRP